MTRMLRKFSTKGRCGCPNCHDDPNTHRAREATEVRTEVDDALRNLGFDAPPWRTECADCYAPLTEHDKGICRTCAKES